MGTVYTSDWGRDYRRSYFGGGYWQSDFQPKATFREIVFSVFIVGILVFIGFLIASAIDKSVQENLLKYRQAAQIRNNPEQFAYALKTDIGNAFVEGDFKTIDPVSMKHLDGQYLFIEKETQEYRKHTRTVTYTDSEGRSRVRHETYWRWDTIATDSEMATKIEFSGVEFDSDTFSYETIRRQKEVYKCGWLSNTRYIFYTIPKDFHGTVFGELKQGHLFGCPEVLYDKNIVEAYKDYTSSHAVSIFWVCWIAFIIFAVGGFCYIENPWLEDSQEEKRKKFARQINKEVATTKQQYEKGKIRWKNKLKS